MPLGPHLGPSWMVSRIVQRAGHPDAVSTRLACVHGSEFLLLIPDDGSVVFRQSLNSCLRLSFLRKDSSLVRIDFQGEYVSVSFSFFLFFFFYFLF